MEKLYTEIAASLKQFGAMYDGSSLDCQGTRQFITDVLCRVLSENDPAFDYDRANQFLAQAGHPWDGPR